MRNTPKIRMNPNTHSLPIKVSFLPDLEDQIYIAYCLSGRVTRSRSNEYLSWAFLVLNIICFPAYVILTDHPLIGLCIFAVSFSLAIFLLPANEQKAVRTFYEKWMEDYIKHPMEVQIDGDGIKVAHNGNRSFLAWKNITAIQETPESIVFFQPTCGIAVRKSAFESGEQQAIMVDHARHYMRSAKLDHATPAPVSAITS